MRKFTTNIFGAVLLSLLLFSTAIAQQMTHQQMKGLDEQVQEIKSDVLSIAAELNRLEERLLFPSHTQLSVFVSLADDESFRLDAVELQLDDRVVAHHLYTYKELEALRMGGVQRIYTGNVMMGQHNLQVTMRGQDASGGPITRQQNFPIEKQERPGIVELSVTQGAMTLTDR